MSIDIFLFICKSDLVSLLQVSLQQTVAGEEGDDYLAASPMEEDLAEDDLMVLEVVGVEMGEVHSCFSCLCSLTCLDIIHFICRNHF